ncbi:MAG: hypothetical protein JWL85_442 [Candidatus Saccharibacteria bacterium]|nr:hypothetical protein [Candidatus Saccharibacteria bacterium]
MHKPHSLHKNETGLVAIVVTMIMMFVLSLIVLSFFRVSQREQRQALDRQLSTQAFYAAESGINDAAEYLKTNTLPIDDTNCNAPPGYNNQIDGSGVITYSCLLMDPSPTSLEYDNIAAGESKVIPIKHQNNSGIDNLGLYWNFPDANRNNYTNCPSAIVFPAAWNTNCDAGMLRIDLVPISPGPFNRANLIDKTMTIFAVPLRSGAGGVATYSAGATGFGGQGTNVGVTCVAALTPTRPKGCYLRIAFTPPLYTQFYMKVMPVYKPASLTVCSPSCGSVAKELADAQTVIDSTGKANDVLRRVQARVPSNNSFFGPFPNYALESKDTICKRFLVAPPLAPRLDPAVTAACPAL